jgi:MFS family permease
MNMAPTRGPAGSSAEVRAAARGTFTEDLYAKLVNDEDARVCTDISDEACRETPGSFLLILISNALTKLGDALASPKTLLPWMATSIGVPAWVIGLLVPLRESGSLLPQLLIGGFVRGLERRKWVWVAGSVVQGVAVACLALTALTLTGRAAGYAVLACVMVFSLARGFCSVASKDVLGKTVPRSRRGQLNGWSSSAAGLVTVTLAAGLLVLGGFEGLGEFYVPMLFCAAVLWFLGALIFARINEFPGETQGGANAMSEAIGRLSILWSDPPFGRFVLARALLMCSALSAPYYVLIAQQQHGSLPALLALFLLSAGLADLVSGPVWGRIADTSSRRVMAVAAGLSSATGIALVLLSTWTPRALQPLVVVPLFYFVLSIAHAGVRVGRKTYVVDLASGNRRTDYVAVSNTVIGVLLLVVGSLGALTPLLGVSGVLLVLAAMGLSGAILCLTLRDT